MSTPAPGFPSSPLSDALPAPGFQGKPFASAAALGNKIRDWVRQAGLVDAEGKAARSPHGIRKRGAEEIAEATGSVLAVMAILSHGDIKTAQIYVDKIQTARLAEKAAREVEALRKQASVPRGLIHGTQGAKSPEETMVSKDEWQPVGLPKCHSVRFQAVSNHPCFIGS